jgi:hypothetical protein
MPKKVMGKNTKMKPYELKSMSVVRSL